MSNLTYFKTDDAGKAQLLKWYYMNNEVEIESGARKVFKGSFPTLFHNYIDEIKRSSHLGSKSKGSPTSLNARDLQENEEHLDKKETTLQLIRIFEHVNIFNLFCPEEDLCQVMSEDSAELLYWRITNGE